jgi:hypothetical protein
MNGIVQAISATMTAPDAGPHLKFLQGLLQATVGQLQQGNAPKPQGQPGQPPGPGGTNINQLMGGQPQPPSAGPQGGPTQTGASADDIRRMVGANAGTPG